jgi:hypothetical protein
MSAATMTEWFTERSQRAENRLPEVAEPTLEVSGVAPHACGGESEAGHTTTLPRHVPRHDLACIGLRAWSVRSGACRRERELLGS